MRGERIVDDLDLATKFTNHSINTSALPALGENIHGMIFSRPSKLMKVKDSLRIYRLDPPTITSASVGKGGSPKGVNKVVFMDSHQVDINTKPEQNEGKRLSKLRLPLNLPSLYAKSPSKLSSNPSENLKSCSASNKYINVHMSNSEITNVGQSPTHGIKKRSLGNWSYVRHTGSVENQSPSKVKEDHQITKTSPFTSTCSSLVMKDPLNRNLEEVFHRRLIRVNPRVKVSLYSPSRCEDVVIPNKLLPTFNRKSRYASVDTGRSRVSRKPSKKLSDVQTSISKFTNISTDKYKREWTINERPDEMLKRYLRAKRKELKDHQFQRVPNSSEIHTGECEVLPSRNDENCVSNIQKPNLSSLGLGKPSNSLSRVKSPHSIPANQKSKIHMSTNKKAKKTLAAKVLRNSVLKKEDLGVEYEGKKYYQIEEVKNIIDFSLGKLMRQYSGTD